MNIDTCMWRDMMVDRPKITKEPPIRCGRCERRLDSDSAYEAFGHQYCGNCIVALDRAYRPDDPREPLSLGELLTAAALVIGSWAIVAAVGWGAFHLASAIWECLQ